jgi:hypothetical protein
MSQQTQAHWLLEKDFISPHRSKVRLLEFLSLISTLINSERNVPHEMHL